MKFKTIRRLLLLISLCVSFGVLEADYIDLSDPFLDLEGPTVEPETTQSLENFDILDYTELSDPFLDLDGPTMEPETTHSLECDIKDPANNILQESITNIIQRVYAEIDTKFAELQLKMESVKKDIFYKLDKITVDISDKIKSDCCQNKKNYTFESQTSIYDSENDKILEKSPELTKHNKNSKSISDHNAPEQQQLSALIENVTNEYDSEDGTTSLVCGTHIHVARSLETGNGVWKDGETPAEDALDKYMIKETGCKYKAIRTGEQNSFEPFEAEYDGKLLEWRGAVRSRQYVYLSVYATGIGTSHKPGYHFDLGRQDNSETRVYRWAPWSHVATISTPGLLTRNGYVWFNLRIQPGRLTFGAVCNPLLKQRQYELNLPRGARVKMALRAYSPDGAKFLYQCPLNPKRGLPYFEPLGF